MAKKVTFEIDTVKLDVPVGSAEAIGYQRELMKGGDVPLDIRGVHLNLHLGPKAATAFMRFRNGLRTTDPRIESNADALRWLFEQLAEAAE